MRYSNNPALLTLPILCVLSALATCWTCIHVAVQKKYVRHTSPFVCMAGAKHECLLVFRLGGILSCSLYTASTWVWLMAYKESREAEDEAFSLGPTKWVGPIMATIASVGFIIMCCFNMYDYSNIHDMAGTVGFTCMSTWGGFLIGSTRDNNSNTVFAVRLAIYLGSQLSLLLFQGFVQKAAKVKKKYKENHISDPDTGAAVDDRSMATLPEGTSHGVSDPSRGNGSDYMTCKPWDNYVTIAAHAEWTALMFFGFLILTLPVDFM